MKLKNFRVVRRYSSPVTLKTRHRVVAVCAHEDYAYSLSKTLNATASVWTRYVVKAEPARVRRATAAA